ncbi:MAG: cupredoxin domain-containing protein [Ardenticatenaceae bacterium]
MRVARLFAYLLFGGVMVALTLLSPASIEAQGERTIRTQGFEFNPPVLTIPAGASVAWENNGTVPFTLTSAEALWEPIALEPGLSYTRFFEQSGTYIYFAAEYGSSDGAGMAGSIVVEPVSGIAPTVTPEPEPGAMPRIVVHDQQSDGRSVVVDEVAAAGTGFLVIHESGADGLIDLFNSIGQVAVQQGSQTNVTVPLDETVSNGAKLFAALHQDDGVPGRYEYPGPDEPVEVSGQLVAESFIVSGPPGVLPETGRSVPPMMVAAAGLVLFGSALLLRRHIARRDPEGFP